MCSTGLKVTISKNILLHATGAALLALCLTPPSFAQTPPPADVDRATREVNEPFREEAEKALAPKIQTPSKEIKEAPEKEETGGPTFVAKKIDLTGGTAVHPDEFKPLIDKYKGKDISVGDLNILCKEIEREYLRKGMIAACFIPPQDIKEGTVILRVVEAKMGELKINDQPFFDKDRIRFYWNIEPGEVLRYDKMSKSVQLMNKNPDRQVGATLHAGKKPETTDVLVDVKTHFPIHGFFSLDNEGAVTTGRNKVGYGVRDNNFLFVDDTLLMGKTFSDHSDSFYAYHTVPFTNFGTSVMYGYSFSKSVPKKEYNVYGMSSTSENTSVFLSQDIYQGAEYAGEFSIGMDANDKVTHTTADGTLNKDRFRVLRIKSTLLHRYPGCITYMLPQISQGINAFGARSANVLSSRSGKADSTFTKFNLTISHKRLLPLNLQASAKFSCQFASEKLASQEEFGIGGLDSVRGYPSQDFTGDWGFLTNFELLIPAFFIPENVKIPYAPEPSLRDSITGVVFFDQGYAEKLGPLITEQVRDSIASFGAGVRMRFFNQVLVRLEWGFPVTPNRPIAESYEAGRFHFALNIDDQVFDEMLRIKKELYEEGIKKTAWKLLDKEMRDPESPLRKKLYGYLYLARIAQEEGKLKIARKYYAKIQTISKAVYKQSETYIKECFEQKKELKKYDETAKQYYYSGDIKKAKEFWEKIEDTRMRPLALEINED